MGRDGRGAERRGRERKGRKQGMMYDRKEQGTK